MSLRGVVRVGDTVRRPVKENSALVHDVLRHLELREFDRAPRFLGIDKKGRTMLHIGDRRFAPEEQGSNLVDFVAAYDAALRHDVGRPPVMIRVCSTVRLCFRLASARSIHRRPCSSLPHVLRAS
jgi:hypothetical protein